MTGIPVMRSLGRGRSGTLLENPGEEEYVAMAENDASSKDQQGRTCTKALIVGLQADINIVSCWSIWA